MLNRNGSNPDFQIAEAAGKILVLPRSRRGFLFLLARLRSEEWLFDPNPNSGTYKTAATLADPRRTLPELMREAVREGLEIPN